MICDWLMGDGVLIFCWGVVGGKVLRFVVRSNILARDGFIFRVLQTIFGFISQCQAKFVELSRFFSVNGV